MITDAALETLDFLNFKASDGKSFTKSLDNKALSYDAYQRIMISKNDVVKRTRQLVYEWLSSRVSRAEYCEDNGVHVYKVPCSPGELMVRVVGDSKTAFCRVLRVAEWQIDWDARCQIVGLKQSLPLEHLLGSLPFWAGKCLPGNEVVKEIKHYFSHLNFNDKSQPYSFSGFLTYSGRLVPVKVEVNIASKVYACAEMHNNR
jgi:hypothetical protein